MPVRQLGTALFLGLVLLSLYLTQRPRTFPPLAETRQLTARPQEVLLTAPDRYAKGLNWWPDGGFGILKAGSTYTFFAGNLGNEKVFAKTIGTLENPTASHVAPKVPIRNLKNAYDYASGGPIYKDPASGMILMIYHAELWYNPKRHAPFYALLGMARSLDGGNTWTDLGEIMRPATPYEEAKANGGYWTVGHGRFLIIDGHFYAYYADHAVKETHRLHVMRANIAEVVRAALNNTVAPWYKFHNGAWSEPGVGGRSTALHNEGHVEAISVSYNEYLDKYVMVRKGEGAGRGGGHDFYYSESSDGITWTSSQLLFDEDEDVGFPTIIGAGSNPYNSAQGFYVYYAYPGNKPWTERSLVRRWILLEGR